MNVIVRIDLDKYDIETLLDLHRKGVLSWNEVKQSQAFAELDDRDQLVCLLKSA